MRINREKLSVAMIRTGMNVNRLVEKSGVSKATVCAIRGGKSCSLSTAQKLVAVLGEWILEKEE